MSRRRARTAATVPHTPDTAALLVAAHDRLTHELGVAAALYAQAREQHATLNGTGDGGGASSGRPTSRPPVSVHALDVLAGVDAWAAWAVRTVNDTRTELVTAKHTGPAVARMVAAARWRPADHDTPAVLRALVHRVHHLAPDLAYADDAHTSLAEHVGKLRPLAAPSGVRRIPLHVPCGTPGCTGEYTMRLTPGVAALDDLVCDLYDEHRLTPAEWQRAQRRRPPNPAAAARLAHTLRGIAP